jgi:hypothetical protein
MGRHRDIVSTGKPTTLLLMVGEGVWWAGEKLVLSFQPGAFEVWCKRCDFAKAGMADAPFRTAQEAMNSLAESVKLQELQP